MATRPTSRKLWCTVINGGQKAPDSFMSSKPTTLTSDGMSRPSSCKAFIAPSAIWSFAAKTAVRSASPAISSIDL